MSLSLNILFCNNYKVFYDERDKTFFIKKKKYLKKNYFPTFLHNAVQSTCREKIVFSFSRKNARQLSHLLVKFKNRIACRARLRKTRAKDLNG